MKKKNVFIFANIICALLSGCNSESGGQGLSFDNSSSTTHVTSEKSIDTSTLNYSSSISSLSSSSEQTINRYTITWKVNDVVTTEVYVYGDIPTFKGDTSKASDTQYTYTFTGWEPAISTVTRDITYVAQYKKSIKTFTITFDAGEGYFGSDKTNHKKELTVKYGETPVFYDVPKLISREYEKAVFSKWDQTIVAAYSDKTYTAIYEYSDKRTAAFCIEYEFDRSCSTIGIKFGNTDRYSKNSVAIDWGDGVSDTYTIDYTGSIITHTYNPLCSGSYLIFVSHFFRSSDESEPFYLSDNFGNGNKNIKRIDILNSTVRKWSYFDSRWEKAEFDSGIYDINIDGLSGLETVFVDGFKSHTRYLNKSRGSAEYHRSQVKIINNSNLKSVQFKSFTSSDYTGDSLGVAEPIVGAASLEYCSFANNSKLSSIDFGSSTINMLGESTFQGCASLKTIKGLNALTVIGDHVFHDCATLNFSSNWFSEISEISPFAFYGCSSLISFNFSSNITLIGDSAFKGCSNLKTIYYNGTVSMFIQISIYSNAFESSGLKQIICSDGILDY